MLSRGSRRGGATRRLTRASSRFGMGRGGVVARGHCLGCLAWLEPRIGSAWAEEMAWHGQQFGLPRLGCLPKMRKLLEFDFSAAVDGAVKDGAVEIETAKMKCQMSELLSAKWLPPPDYSLPSWSSSIRSFEVYDILAQKSLPRWVSVNWFTLSHWREISLSSRTGEQTHMGVGELVYPIALESN